MKKLVSVILSVLMVVAVAAASVTAFAATVASPESRPTTVVTEVNGKPDKNVTYTQDGEHPRVYTFTYTGNGKLIGWEFPGMKEGTDYTITSQKGNSITIEVSDDYTGDVIANAIVEFDTKADNGNKSPKTGAAAAAGIVAMGAGAAILAISKKRRND